MATITKINITFGNHSLDLTLEEAKELQNLLNETFPDLLKPVTISPLIIERVIREPYYPPYRSYYGWEVTCNTQGDNAVLCWTKTS